MMQVSDEPTITTPNGEQPDGGMDGNGFDGDTPNGAPDSAGVQKEKKGFFKKVRNRLLFPTRVIPPTQRCQFFSSNRWARARPQSGMGVSFLAQARQGHGIGRWCYLCF